MICHFSLDDLQHLHHGSHGVLLMASPPPHSPLPPIVAFLFYATSPRRSLPPSPAGLPIIGKPLLLGKPLGAIGQSVHRLRSVYGPVFTLPIPGRTSIFIADHASAHRALVASGTTFANRPQPPTPGYIGVASAGHGPVWRLLWRNLTSKVLHPARIKYYADARASARRLLLGKLAAEPEAADCVQVDESFRYTMFSLLMFMCFGEKMEEELLKEAERRQREMIMSVVEFNLFSFLPRFTKFLFWKRWNKNQASRRRQMEVFVPLIRARMAKRDCCSYVDSLLRLELPEESGRKLTEKEMAIICSEFVGLLQSYGMGHGIVVFPVLVPHMD